MEENYSQIREAMGRVSNRLGFVRSKFNLIKKIKA